jgi:predicted nucleotidyltransferase
MIVLRAAFFGSIVRGEMTDESDVGILVELAGRQEPDGPLGPHDRGSRRRFGGEVDVLT